MKTQKYEFCCESNLHKRTWVDEHHLQTVRPEVGMEKETFQPLNITEHISLENYTITSNGSFLIASSSYELKDLPEPRHSKSVSSSYASNKCQILEH